MGRRNHSKILQELTNDHGLTTTEIAKRTGLSSGAIRDWRSGRYYPTKKNREKLNRFYKTFQAEQAQGQLELFEPAPALDVVALDSRLVAEMAEKEHTHLLRDIRQYSDYLKYNPDLDATEFWTASTYTASNGKVNPCYMVTKKGCEFIQHKMTGQKGAIFTARYINAFWDMGEAHQKPQEALEQPQGSTLAITLKEIEQQARRLNRVKNLLELQSQALDLYGCMDSGWTEVWKAHKLNSLVALMLEQHGDLVEELDDTISILLNADDRQELDDRFSYAVGA